MPTDGQRRASQCLSASKKVRRGQGARGAVQCNVNECCLSKTQKECLRGLWDDVDGGREGRASGGRTRQGRGWRPFCWSVFAVWAPRDGGRGTGAKEGNSDCCKWVDRAQRPTRLRARDRGVKDSEEQSGFGRGRKKRKRPKIRAGMAQVYVGGRGRRWMEILGPAWKVDLFAGDAPYLARSGPGWAAGGNEGCGHPSGFCARGLHDVHVGARGSTRRRTRSCLLGRTRETGTWKLSHD